MKGSIVLLEMIFSLILFSIIAIVSSKMIYSLVLLNRDNTFIVQNNLILETTRLFLSKKGSLINLKRVDNNLYFDNNLLLENISKYELTNKNNITIINICIYEDTICQVWKMKN